MAHILFRTAAFVTVVSLLGCGGGGKAPVHGKVTLPDGSPAKGVIVSFSDAAKQIGAVGNADDEGVYHLMTDKPGDGAPPGVYQVTVSQPGPEDSSQGEPPRIFPKRYESTETSKLKYEVKPGDNTYDIKLEAQ